MKRTVSDLMRQRNLGDVPTIDESLSALDALRVLQEKEIGALVVTRSGVVSGIFSERDFARAAVSKKLKLSAYTKVHEIMSKKVIYVTLDYRLDECLAVMSKMRIRHLPVLKGDEPVAFLSMRHIMEALIEDNQFMVEQLVTYITGANPAEELPPIRYGLTKYRSDSFMDRVIE